MAKSGVIGKLERQISAGRCVLAAWIGTNDASVAELLAREAYDAMVLDMQHGAIDVPGAIAGIAASALAGKPAIVRIPVGEFATASRVIDAGAAGVIAPMVNSASDARRFVEHMKFPPLGQRSWGPRGALSLSGLVGPAYLHSANAFTLAIAMIETREALAALDDILSVPGIDGVFVGPADLSISLSAGGVVDAQSGAVEAELDRIAARAKAHGKFAALFCFEGARARAMAARGFLLCSVSTDQQLLRLAARIELAAARDKS